MNTELRKRLEKAAGEYARQYYQDADFAIVITYDALDKNLKRAVNAGAKHGYKEAIAQAKEILRNWDDVVWMEQNHKTMGDVSDALQVAEEALDKQEEMYIPSADYLNAAKKAFQKACGWLSVYPWYQGVYEEFVKELEDNL